VDRRVLSLLCLVYRGLGVGASLGVGPCRHYGPARCRMSMSIRRGYDCKHRQDKVREHVRTVASQCRFTHTGV
jgi:hypothetical protein